MGRRPPRTPRAGAPWTSRSTRPGRRSGARGRSGPATRAAIPTGQSAPGETIPSTSRARASRSTASSSSDDRTARSSARREPDRLRVAVDRDHVDVPRPAPPRSRPSCAGPAPRTRRRRRARGRPRHQASFSRYQATVRSSPSSNPIDARQPVSSCELVGRPDVPVDLTGPLLDVDGRRRAGRRRPRARAGRSRSTEMSTPVATFTTSPATRSSGASISASIADAVSSTWSQSRLARPSPWIVSGSPASAWVTKRGTTFSGCWRGAVVVERPDDHHREPVGHAIAVREPVAARLRRGVRAARVERVLLVHRVALGRAVDLAGRDQQEPLDRGLPDRVEQDLRSLDVGRHELGGTLADRLLDVRLRGGVDDDVDPADDLADEPGVADVAVDELESRMAHDVGEVLEVPRIRERVERDHLVRRVLEQVADEVRRDEPGPAGDEDTAHLRPYPPSVRQRSSRVDTSVACGARAACGSLRFRLTALCRRGRGAGAPRPAGFCRDARPRERG